MSLLKVPFPLSVMYCTYTTMTPPTHTPPKSEKLPPTGWELIVPWFPYIPKAIFMGLSICEAAAIVASAFPGSAAGRARDLLTLLTFSTPATALHLRITPVFLCGWACIALASFFALALVPRMNKEDRMLKKRFGKHWERWRMAVPCRLIPGVY